MSVITSIANARKLASRESQSQADILFFCTYLHHAFGKTGYKVMGMVQSLTEKMMVIAVPEFGGVNFNCHYHLMELVTEKAENSIESQNEDKPIENLDNQKSNQSSTSYVIDSFSFNSEASSCNVRIVKESSNSNKNTTNSDNIQSISSANNGPKKDLVFKMFDHVPCYLVCKTLDLMMDEMISVKLVIQE